jgi:hypothetical protein
MIKTGERTEEAKVNLYFPCYKYCKTCKEKDEYYNNKYTSCLNGYKNINNMCILENSDIPIIPHQSSDKESDNVYKYFRESNQTVYLDFLKIILCSKKNSRK